MRLTPLRKDDLTGERLELFEAMVDRSVGRDESFVFDEQGYVRGPFNPLLHHPRSGVVLKDMAAVLRFSGVLPAAAREAVILVVAAFWREGHEWWAHEHVARAAGITDDELVEMHERRPATFADPVTRAAHDAAFAIVHRGDLTDEEHAAARAALSEEELVEVTVLIGYYALLSMQLHVFRVPTPHTF